MQRESSKFSQRRCAFLSNKGKEGWEEERRVYPWASLQGITLWVPERERDRRVEEHPVTYQSPLFWFYLFHVFFRHLFTQIVSPSTFPAFQLMHCSVWTHVIVVETRERGRWGLQTPNLSFCLQAVKVVAVTFHLLYNNSTVYASNSSVKCVFTTVGSLFSSASVLLPPLFPCVWNDLLYPDRADDGNQFFAAPTLSDSR